MAADVSAVSKYTGTLHCLKNIYHESGSGILGILGIYRGSGVAFLGAILYRALYLGGFDIGKDVILGKDNSDRRHSLWWKYGIAQVIINDILLLAFFSSSYFSFFGF